MTSDIEKRPEDDLIRCRLCFEHNCIKAEGVWIRKKSLKAHISSASHKKSKAFQEKKEKEARVVEARIRRNETEAIAQIRAEGLTIGVTQGHIGSISRRKPLKVGNNATITQRNAETEFWKDFDAGIEVYLGSFGGESNTESTSLSLLLELEHLSNGT